MIIILIIIVVDLLFITQARPIIDVHGIGPRRSYFGR